MNTLRIPPHSAEAEESVIGALLLDRDAIIVVAEFLMPSHFYDDRHKEIFECILELYEERVPIDVLTVAERLKKRKVLKKVGGATLLAELANKVPTAAHVEHYGRIVKDHAVKRSLMTAASRLIDFSLDEGLSAAELLDKAESEVFSLTQAHIKKAFAPVREALAESFDRLDELHKQAEGLRGVPTGFKDLDDALAGMQKSNLLILASRPGVGKTSLALNIAQNVAVKFKRPVGFFSLEMSKEELVDRLLVAQADIDAWRLKTGKLSEDDFTKLSNAMGELAEAPLYIDDTPALSILEMRTKARRLQVEHGVDFIVVDYLQLARSRQLENRVQEVSEISQGLKNLARELKIPVLALSQLSRAVEQRGGQKKPQLADLRESGCLFGDTLILRADTGERVKIRSLVGKENIEILALDNNFKLISTAISKVFPSGRKMTYKMTLKSGKVIEASGNHPFLMLDGWMRLEKLKIGDRIAAPRIMNLKPSREKALSGSRIILLAHLIGNGCYVKRQPLHYTNSDMELIKTVAKVAEKEFSVVPKIIKQENWYHVYLSAKEKLARGRRNPIVKWLDESLGIYGQRSREKYVPDIVFRQDNRRIALFLRHIWSTNGSIFLKKENKKGAKASIYYSTGSRRLAEDVSHFLLRLGIVSTIRSSSKKGYEDMWIVNVQGKSEQIKFFERIGIVGEKAKLVPGAIKTLKSIKENPNNDVIPKEIWKYIEKVRVERGLTTRQFHEIMGWAYSGTQRHGNGVGRKRLAKIAKVLSEDRLMKLSNSDLYWDEIKNIKKIGIKTVFDATVPKYANFIANDIIVHNSIEQDADVVMFIWREDEEKLENIVLDISKHRNGPLKQINLFFKGDRIKFYGRETKREK